MRSDIEMTKIQYNTLQYVCMYVCMYVFMDVCMYMNVCM